MTDPGVATSAPVPWSLRILSCTPWFSPLYSEAAATGFRSRRSLQMDFVARHAEKRIRTALSDTRVVAIVGPRQSGKTTLARRISAGSDRPYVSLDDTQSRRFAQSDPVGFLRGMESATIDEIQRAPDLVLEVKKAVDQDPRPGRFLITGLFLQIQWLDVLKPLNCFRSRKRKSQIPDHRASCRIPRSSGFSETGAFF